MILVDSSVWIDYFNGADNPYTAKLDSLLGVELIGIGDIILTEILQGFQNDKEFNTAKAVLLGLTIFDMIGQKNAITVAENYRFLRKKASRLEKQSIASSPPSAYKTVIRCSFATRIFNPFRISGAWGCGGIKYSLLLFLID
jgi:predicted nucleic acid-binding protein